MKNRLRFLFANLNYSLYRGQGGKRYITAVHRGLKAQLSRTNQLITYKRLKFILIGGTDFKISNPKIFKFFWIKNEMMEDHKRLWNLIQLESLNEVLNEKNK